ncbi:hypothetical protein M8C21_005641 [Ambrosia artemisiifolia]|uniref:SWIM-type domain-containing protein n=1 Tax=Ambrosia artemisiifolia TaxID=4212 RepID=A0AAD5BL04_AMBAR|nr:hypothetical protein M8C21_005641 [Ambrosia artemisiifolia]
MSRLFDGDKRSRDSAFDSDDQRQDSTFDGDDNMFANNDDQIRYSPVPSDNTVFEVRSEKYSYVVNIDEQTCSCRLWQLSGIPCVHTVAALTFINKDPENFVSFWLKKDMFREAYKYPIKPLRGSAFWPKTDDIKPLPPKKRCMSGRPSVKRKRNADEKEKKNPKVGIGRKMSCQNCPGTGHNVRSCTNEKKDPSPKVKRPKGAVKSVMMFHGLMSQIKFEVQCQYDTLNSLDFVGFANSTFFYKFRVLMDQDAARTAKESLELVFQMSNILDTGLDRHTLSVLIALCDLGVNPEALAAVVKEFRRDQPLTSSTSTSN